MSRSIEIPGAARPRGYSSAMLAAGEHIYVSGQVGWNSDEVFETDDFAEQAAQALRNVVAILHAAGAKADSIVRLTWYVTDKREYRAAMENLGKAYRDILGRHYPAMTLVEVSALLEDRAKVEIEATAVRTVHEE